MSKNIYVGKRYVPKIVGQWDKNKSYESLSIVLNQGDSYTSKQDVPIGVELSNSLFWVKTGDYNAQIQQMANDVTNISNTVNKNSEDIEVNNLKIKTLENNTNNNIQSIDSLNKNVYNLNILNYNPKNTILSEINIKTYSTDYIPQCMLFINNKILIGMCNKDSSKNGKILTFNNFILESENNIDNAGHFNDMTFDGTYIYISTMIRENNKSKILKINQNFAVVDTILFEENAVNSNIAYNKLNDTFILGRYNNMTIVNKNFEVIKTINLQMSNKQYNGMEIKDNLIYWYSNNDYINEINFQSIEVYNLNGQLLREWKYNNNYNYDESEGICNFNDNILIMSYNVSTMYIKLLNFKENTHTHNLEDIINSSLYQNSNKDYILYVDPFLNENKENTFKTIQQAINKIPLTSNAIIKIKNGTYNENVVLENHSGIISIVRQDTSLSKDNYIINGSITVRQSRISLTDITLLNDEDGIIKCNDSLTILKNCNLSSNLNPTSAFTLRGIINYFGKLYCDGCNFNKRGGAIYCSQLGNAIVRNITGTENHTSFVAETGAKIIKGSNITISSINEKYTSEGGEVV